MSEQSILLMFSRRDNSQWWWLQKNDRTNIGSHFKPYKWDTKKSATKDELINTHGWIHIGGNSLVAWNDE